MMTLNLFAIGGLLLFIICSILVLIILKYAKSRIQYTWSLFNVAVGIWGIGAFFIGIARNENIAVLAWRIAHIGILFIPIFLFHFIYLLCQSDKKILLVIAYLQGLLFNLLIISGNSLFVPSVRYVSKFHIFYANLGLLYHIVFIFWLFLVIYSHFVLFKFYLKTYGIKKNQLTYLFFGTLVGFLGGLTNFFPAYKIDIYPYGNFTIILYCIIVTYAILRFRLLDISLAITRTGLFVAIYSLVLGLPFIVAYALKPYLLGFFGDKWWLGPMGLLTVLATVGPFIYIYIERRAEERLLREQREYQNTLRKASSGMIRVRDLKRLLNLIVHMLTRTVKIEFAAIFLFDTETNQYKMSAKRDATNLVRGLALENNSPLIEHLRLKKEAIVYEEVQLQSQDSPHDIKLSALEKHLQEIKAAVVIPSFVGNKLLGFLVLGKKHSGKLYSQDDLNVFSVLANQAALAVENAQFYEDIKETQEQLFQAEKMATVGTMADGLSHQINNRFQALSLIAGDSLDIVQNTSTLNCSPEVKEAFEQLKYALQRIQTNVVQGGDIVKGLLKYSRPGEKGFEYIEFNKIIYGALEMAQYKVRLHELDIKREIPPDLPQLKCNLTQFEEVFFNLIDNAYDAIRERKEVLKEEGFRGKIVISAASRDNHIWITFQDNGIGVKDKDKSKLFTPFFTTKATGKKGTGLGLYVIQKIIGFHEGTISIDSSYGHGTKFEIVLPLSSR